MANVLTSMADSLMLMAGSLKRMLITGSQMLTAGSLQGMLMIGSFQRMLINDWTSLKNDKDCSYLKNVNGWFSSSCRLANKLPPRPARQGGRTP